MSVSGVKVFKGVWLLLEFFLRQMPSLREGGRPVEPELAARLDDAGAGVWAAWAQVGPGRAVRAAAVGTCAEWLSGARPGVALSGLGARDGAGGGTATAAAARYWGAALRASPSA